MTDIATVTRNAHATGFEAGSLITLQTVMAYLDGCGGSAFAAAISTASQDGTLERFRPGKVYPQGIPQVAMDVDIPAPKPDPVSTTDLGPPKLNREQASQMGFTGNCCSSCGSYQMVRNGTCEKCNSCGSTTGCS